MCKSSITNLKCEYLSNPLGIDTLIPRLSWMFEAEGYNVVQKAYRILVSDSEANIASGIGNIWDSGKIFSDQSINIVYKGEKLKSFKRYFWKVSVWFDKSEKCEWSKTAYWEMGPIAQDDWKASWISAPWSEETSSAPMFRRVFDINKKIRHARAYICGLGYYELYINGMKIGDNVLDPAQTDYEQRVLYVTHDITENLLQGRNAVGVILGDGWYNQNQVWKVIAPSYGKPRLIIQLLLTYEDETTEIITSDEEMRAYRSPIVSNNIYAGEIYDARLEEEGWSNPGYDDSDWDKAVSVEGPGGKLISQRMPPIRKMGILKPQRITFHEPGIYVVDMGQNFAGWASLQQPLHLHPAEENYKSQNTLRWSALSTSHIYPTAARQCYPCHPMDGEAQVLYTRD